MKYYNFLFEKCLNCLNINKNNVKIVFKICNNLIKIINYKMLILLVVVYIDLFVATINCT